MAYSKKIASKNEHNQQKAIDAHAGFVTFVVGKVKKVGLETVLQQYDSSHATSEYFWLRKAFERVLDFAEQVQIKKIPTSLEGKLEHDFSQRFFELAESQLDSLETEIFRNSQKRLDASGN